MKKTILAVIVSLLVIGSYVATPIVTFMGVKSLLNAELAFFDTSVKTADRQGEAYNADIYNSPVSNTGVSENTYETSLKVTDHSKGYSGDVPIYRAEQKDENKLNIIMMYYDPIPLLTESEKKETDMSVLLTVDFKKEEFSGVYLDNNLYVPIEEHGWNRLGSALEYGGMGLYINTVNSVFAVDVQYYILLDLSDPDKIAEFFNEVGGVDITLDQEIVDSYKGKYDFHVGKNHLNGDQLVDLFKKRNDISSNSDIPNEVSQEFLRIMSELFGKEGIAHLGDTIRLVSGVIKTNMDTKTLYKYLMKSEMNLWKYSAGEFITLDDYCDKAIVDDRQTGGKMSVLKMRSIEEVRRAIKKKIYG